MIVNTWEKGRKISRGGRKWSVAEGVGQVVMAVVLGKPGVIMGAGIDTVDLQTGE